MGYAHPGQNERHQTQRRVLARNAMAATSIERRSDVVLAGARQCRPRTGIEQRAQIEARLRED